LERVRLRVGSFSWRNAPPTAVSGKTRFQPTGGFAVAAPNVRTRGSTRAIVRPRRKQHATGCALLPVSRYAARVSRVIVERYFDLAICAHDRRGSSGRGRLTLRDDAGVCRVAANSTYMASAAVMDGPPYSERAETWLRALLLPITFKLL